MILPGAPVSLVIPAYPINPPSPDATKLGRISWDLPEMVKYEPYQPVQAHVEMLNPTQEMRLYGISYFFLDKDGFIAQEGMIEFMILGGHFISFYLPGGAEHPAFTDIVFSAPGYDYTFGLRLLLLEKTNGTANVLQETCRIRVMLASEETYNEHYGLGISGFLPMMPMEGPPLPRFLGIKWPWAEI